MGQKDIVEKILESYDDVFADIVNVLLFDGEQVLNPSELEEQAPRRHYNVQGKVRETERDVVKRWKKGNVRIACVGVENQTNPNADMPLRVLAYDGAEYRAQLLADNENKDRYPVVTLVLYFGHDKHWDQPLTLKECIDIPEKFQPFVNDYKINLFEIAYLTHEQVAMFKSDFGIVADYFVQKRESGGYTPEPKDIKHVHETMQMLSVMAEDNRFLEAYKNEPEGGIRNMCDVLDRIENKGRLEGELKAKKTMAIRMYKRGDSVEDIADILQVTVETVKEWIEPAFALA